MSVVFLPQAVLVHTAETVRLRYFLEMLMANRRPVMLVGGAGCGKTVLVNNKLNSLRDEYLVTTIPFNHYTTSLMLQGVMEKPLEKKAGEGGRLGGGREGGWEGGGGEVGRREGEKSCMSGTCVVIEISIRRVQLGVGPKTIVRCSCRYPLNCHRSRRHKYTYTKCNSQSRHCQNSTETSRYIPTSVDTIT